MNPQVVRTKTSCQKKGYMMDKLPSRTTRLMTHGQKEESIKAELTRMGLDAPKEIHYDYKVDVTPSCSLYPKDEDVDDPTIYNSSSNFDYCHATLDKNCYADAASDSDNKYGYGDADPDLAAGAQNKYAAPETDNYGYGEAAPDSDKYCYGDATSDSRNGYQDADTVGVGWIKHAVPRRSSLKPSSSAASVGGMTITSHRKKRATMSFGSSVEPTEFKKRLSVGFSSCLQINEAAPSQDYLTTADLQYIEKQNAKIVKYTLKGGTDKHFCTRGLEDQIQHTSQHRKAALQAVFEEQTKMKEEEGTVDSKRLSERYRMATWQTTVDAAERAETDTADIASYLRKDRKQLLRNNPEGSSRSTRRKAQRRMSCMY